MKIFHAADLHLDSPFQGLDREKAALRRAEQRALLLKLGDMVKRSGADVAVFAGDLFDSDEPFTETGLMLAQTLSAMELPVFIAPGNHDFYGPRSAWAGLPLGKNVHLFTESGFACVELPALHARVYGSAFTDRSRTAPLAGFTPPEPDDIINIMLLHGEVGVPRSPYGAITEQELAASGMDYVALGHIHAAGGLRRAGHTFYAWPGCPEGRGFDETGEKGVLLTTVEKGSCTVEFLPVEGRRYHWKKVDITNSDDPYATLSAALEGDMRQDVCRVTLTGETERPPELSALKSALEGRFFALELRDATRPGRELWAQADEDSLRGLFLSRLHKLYAAAGDDREKERIARAARWGLRAMENGEELTI